jgi:hypothetical protein
MYTMRQVGKALSGEIAMYHKSVLGSAGDSIPCDANGFIPDLNDEDPCAFTFDHGDEKTHTPYGSLTEYGQWWVDEGYPDWLMRGNRCLGESSTTLS